MNAKVIDVLSGPEQNTLIIGGYPGKEYLQRFQKFEPLTLKSGEATTIVLVASLEKIDQDASIDGMSVSYSLDGTNHADQTRLKYLFQQKLCER